jgi:nicotinamidase/pyrazinamidase
MLPALGSLDALIIVDVQKDFCPGGALPIRNGDEVVPVLNRWIEAAARTGAPVFASRDWHPPDHLNFASRGGIWPPHCVQGSEGAAFHPDLRLPDDAVIISKGTDRDREAYSAFEGTDLAERLTRRGRTRLWIGGLAQEFCVKQTVLEARRLGFEVHLIEPATRAVNLRPDDGERALAEMREADVRIEEEAP